MNRRNARRNANVEPEGEKVHVLLNSVVRRNHVQRPPPVAVFTGYTTTEEERAPYHAAKYNGGENKIWAICQILKLAPNFELPFKHLYDIYYGLYEVVLDDRTVRKIFGSDDGMFARSVFMEETDYFKVRNGINDFIIQLKNPDEEFVPQQIRDRERDALLRA